VAAPEEGTSKSASPVINDIQIVQQYKEHMFKQLGYPHVYPFILIKEILNSKLSL